jgi:hypothetical protein
MIPDNVEERTDGVMVLYKIISRYSWDRLQALHKSCPGSSVEHLMHGLYVLHIPPGGAKGEEAAA